MTPTLPPLFLSHGSPMTALQPREAGRFMQALGPALDECFGRPHAVLAISAHTLSPTPVLLAAPHHHAVYDFGGFDPRLRTLRYDAPGAPALAQAVATRLQAAGLAVHLRPEGGLDHGLWTPLRYLWPSADVPVLPLAWPPQATAAQLFALGQALAPLAQQRVLILGSGSITHNLQRVFAGGLDADIERPATPESTAFRDWFAGRAAQADWPSLLDWQRQAPHARLMHPSDEHLMPWFVAAGAGATPGAAGRRIHSSLTYGDLGMDAYAFGGAGVDRLVQALQAQPGGQG